MTVINKKHFKIVNNNRYPWAFIYSQKTIQRIKKSIFEHTCTASMKITNVQYGSFKSVHMVCEY